MSDSETNPEEQFKTDRQRFFKRQEKVVEDDAERRVRLAEYLRLARDGMLKEGLGGINMTPEGPTVEQMLTEAASSLFRTANNKLKRVSAFKKSSVVQKDPDDNTPPTAS